MMSWRKPTIALLASLALVSTATTACSSKNDTGTSSGGMIEQLVLPAEGQASQGGLANYNTYAPNPVVWNGLFEPLMIRNKLTCELVPWLATGFKWDGSNKLTFTIRDGVKWSDGQAFSAKDVAFTLNLGKQYPGADRAGMWNDTFGAPASSVTADGSNVTITFGGNAVVKFDDIISVPILAEHVYASVGDPTKYIDTNPVATGPFKVGSYNGRRLVLERRDDYWQADKIKIKKIIHEGQFEAAQAALALSSGQLDMYQGEIPNVQRTFVDKDPAKNHFFYAPAGMTIVVPNLTKAPFSDVKFREAIAYLMNKDEISQKATYGIMKPASQSGLKLPFAAKLLPTQYTTQSATLPYDVGKAGQFLDAAGYKKGSDGKRTTPDGKPFSLTFSVQAGWIDYEAMADVVARGLNEAGVDTKIVKSNPDSIDAQKKSGDFDLVLDYLNGGCQLSRDLGAKLQSTQVPTANTINPNVERFIDPATDAVVAKLSASTDEAEQKTLTGQLVQTMMTKFPIIPILYAPDRLIYRTDHASGWPSEDNPYTNPGEHLLIYTHLTAPQS
jgi:peptide/nickel transport system substrate-binding protein